MAIMRAMTHLPRFKKCALVARECLPSHAAEGQAKFQSMRMHCLLLQSCEGAMTAAFALANCSLHWVSQPYVRLNGLKPY